MNNQMLHDDFKPRIIVWQLTNKIDDCPKYFDFLEKYQYLLIIDSIARLSKPIIVLTGDHVIELSDLQEIVEYGNALGLKLIIELLPEELNNEIIERYKCYGKRIFRLIIDDAIIEDMDFRYKSTESFAKLEKAVKLLKENLLDVHFSYTVKNLDIRNLTFAVDYAFRKGAKGIYCHLRFDKNMPLGSMFDDEIHSPDEFISKLSEIKCLVPNGMYLSPQCVGYISSNNRQRDIGAKNYPIWIHQCLAGKTFAFINQVGKVFVCSRMCKECGDLRDVDYDFKNIWTNSEILNYLREYSRSCEQTRALFKQENIFNDYNHQIING